MNYGALQYSLKDRAFDIFLSGCDAPHCDGCHNPQLWDFHYGSHLDHYDLVENLETKVNMIDKIRLMGGEPFDQPLDELLHLVKLIEVCFPTKEIWIFTRYEYKELTSMATEVLNHVDYCKHGRFIKDLEGVSSCEFTGLELASSNQYVQHYPLRRWRLEGRVST